MRGIWIAVGIIAVVDFAFYCCLRVASKEDELMEKHRRDETGNAGGGQKEI